MQVTEEEIEVLATEVDGAKLLFVDGVTVARNGLIYFTDASTKFPLEIRVLDILEDRPNGRILLYNPETNTITMLLKDLYFPNGIALSKDESFVVFAETSATRVRKYSLNKGQLQSLNENLPGYPDNVHYNARKDVLYIGIVGQRNAVLDLLWIPVAEIVPSHVPIAPTQPNREDGGFVGYGRERHAAQMVSGSVAEGVGLCHHRC